MPIAPIADALIVGGSYAGLSAALQLARARRRVTVVDAGLRRNRFASASHGFLGQDGRPPEAIAAEAREQLLAYPTVTWVTGKATTARQVEGGFALTLESGDTLTGRTLVLATGVVDELPAIPGLAAHWGKHLFACPYCHGYEVNQGRIGVIATGPLSIHQALLLPDWGPTTFFLNGAMEPDEAQRASLAARGVTVEAEPVAEVLADAPTLRLRDGRLVALDGLFTATRTHAASPLAEQLGCAFDEGPMGPFIRTDMAQETTVPGVFACGDAARMAGNVAFAVADGAMAGIGAHRSLVFPNEKAAR